MNSDGKALEKFLGDYHLALQVERRARVFHVPTPHRIVGFQNRRFSSTPDKPVWADFAGLLKGGRALAIEAKARTLKSVRLDHLSFGQKDVLAEVHELGGVALVYARLIRKEIGHVDLCVPWCVFLAEGRVRDTDTAAAWWSPPPDRGWCDAAEHWDAYIEGGWPAVEAIRRAAP